MYYTCVGVLLTPTALFAAPGSISIIVQHLLLCSEHFAQARQFSLTRPCRFPLAAGGAQKWHVFQGLFLGFLAGFTASVIIVQFLILAAEKFLWRAAAAERPYSAGLVQSIRALPKKQQRQNFVVVQQVLLPLLMSSLDAIQFRLARVIDSPWVFVFHFANLSPNPLEAIARVL